MVNRFRAQTGAREALSAARARKTLWAEITPNVKFSAAFSLAPGEQPYSHVTQHLLRICLLLILCSVKAFAQGPLTPPTAATPSMKSLQQIEPRVDLQNALASAGVTTTNADCHFVIT